MPHQPQQNPRSSQPNSFPSLEYQRALQLSIPIVQPTWLFACLAERKMVPISAHYLGAHPPNLSSLSLNSSTSSNAAGKSGQTERPSYSPKGSSSTPSSPSAARDSETNLGRSRAGSAAPDTTLSKTHKLRVLPGEPGGAGLPVVDEVRDDSVVPQPLQIPAEELSHDHTSTKESPVDPLSSSRPAETHQEPAVPAPLGPAERPSIPPARQSGIADILNEIVDAPENDNYQPAVVRAPDFIPQEKSATLTTPEESSTISSSGHQLSTSSGTSPTQGKHAPEDLEDDPFSAASPTVSHPSPYMDGGHLQLNLSAAPSPVTPVRVTQGHNAQTSAQLGPATLNLSTGECQTVLETGASKNKSLPRSPKADEFEDVLIGGYVTSESEETNNTGRQVDDAMNHKESDPPLNGVEPKSDIESRDVAG